MGKFTSSRKRQLRAAKESLTLPAAEPADAGRDADRLKNALASLAWSSHPRGYDYTAEIMREVYALIDAAALASQQAVKP